MAALELPGHSPNPGYELIASRRFPLREMCTHTFPLDEAEHAVRVVGREIPGEDPIHVTLIP